MARTGRRNHHQQPRPPAIAGGPFGGATVNKRQFDYLVQRLRSVKLAIDTMPNGIEHWARLDAWDKEVNDLSRVFELGPRTKWTVDLFREALGVAP